MSGNSGVETPLCWHVGASTLEVLNRPESTGEFITPTGTVQLPLAVKQCTHVVLEDGDRAADGSMALQASPTPGATRATIVKLVVHCAGP